MATSSFNKVNAFVEALAEGGHDLQNDSFVVALLAAANAPDANSSKISDETEIAYTNVSSRALTVSASAQSSGTYKWTLADLTITANGGNMPAFRYAVIVNNTKAAQSPEPSNIVGYYDYGEDLALLEGESVTLDFDGTNGVFTLT